MGGVAGGGGVAGSGGLPPARIVKRKESGVNSCLACCVLRLARSAANASDARFRPFSAQSGGAKKIFFLIFPYLFYS